MPKRCNDDSHTDSSPAKRARKTADDRLDRLSALSDELLLHILSFLPRPALITCQRVSHRFYALGGDSELWKRQYYTRWVRPRARRLANARRATLPLSRSKSRVEVDYSPRVSTWLDHSHLAGEGQVTNWKRQYRLRHNWARGICRLTEVELPSSSPSSQPSMLVELCAGLVLTADTNCGLRAWFAKDPRSCVAGVSLSDGPEEKEKGRSCRSAPTALTASRSRCRNVIDIGVGFQDGRFHMYCLDLEAARLHLRFAHGGGDDGAITAMASSSPYLLTVTQHKALSLYELPDTGDPGDSELAGVRQLASLQADSIMAPISLSLRTTASEIIASIVYSFFHLGCAWSLGIQELRLDKSGQQIGSQLATTVDSQYGIKPLQALSRLGKRYSTLDDSPLSSRLRFVPTEASIVHQEPPTSISYSHPYLLTSHADNTLTMYLVMSTTEDLVIRSGQRLWGHTSGVSAVQVSDRGKAVSVSTRGNEIRIWELESAVSLFGMARELKEENSIAITAEGQREDEGGKRRGVGFDEERVMIVREGGRGQVLESYDFT